MSNTVDFMVSFDAKAWDSAIGGWRSSALRLPGASVDEVFSAGKSVDRVQWRHDGEHLRWSGDPRPLSVVVRVRVPADLHPAADLEAQKLELERDKHKAESKWRVIALVASLLTTMTGSAVTYLVGTHQKEDEDNKTEQFVISTGGAIRDCRNKIVRLNTAAKREEATIEGLRSHASGVNNACVDTLDVLVEMQP